MSRATHQRRRSPVASMPCDDGSIGSADVRDLPTCASGPTHRFAWTIREIVDILRRRS